MLSLNSVFAQISIPLRRNIVYALGVVLNTVSADWMCLMGISLANSPDN